MSLVIFQSSYIEVEWEIIFLVAQCMYLETRGSTIVIVLLTEWVSHFVVLHAHLIIFL